MTSKGLLSGGRIGIAINNYIPGNLDGGEQTEYVVPCLGKQRQEDNRSVNLGAGCGQAWGIAVSSNSADQPVWFGSIWDSASQRKPCEPCKAWLGTTLYIEGGFTAKVINRALVPKPKAAKLIHQEQ